jgi:hypothetical protein
VEELAVLVPEEAEQREDSEERRVEEGGCRVPPSSPVSRRMGILEVGEGLDHGHELVVCPSLVFQK